MPRKPGIRRVAKRRYWKEADARVMVEAWRRSDEPLSEFAIDHGVVPRRLSRWVNRLEGVAAGSGPVRFHQVRVVQTPAEHGPRAASIEIELTSGERVHVPQGFAADDLRRVLALLAEAASC